MTLREPSFSPGFAHEYSTHTPEDFLAAAQILLFAAVFLPGKSMNEFVDDDYFLLALSWQFGSAP